MVAPPAPAIEDRRALALASSPWSTLGGLTSPLALPRPIGPSLSQPAAWMSALGPRPWPAMGVGSFYPSVWRHQFWSHPTPPQLPPPPTCPDPYRPPPPLALAPHLAHLNDFLVPPPRVWYPPPLPCCLKGEAPATVQYKRGGLEQRASPGRELPSKLQRQERVKERTDMVAPLGLDRDVAAARLHSKKSASTQTQFSSFPGDPPCYYASHVTVTTESYSATNTRSSFAPAPVEGATQSEDVQHAPLNLSMSSAPPPPSQPPRPSVITLASANGGRSSGGSTSPVDVAAPSSTRVEKSTNSIDPDIEEHFRRSLGRNYTDMMHAKSAGSSPHSASSPPKPASPTYRDVSTTGTVDDHFAKSLGSTWKTLTAQTAPFAEMLPGTVDDHFAMSLGPTWLRIKAEREPPSCNSSSGSPPNPSLLST